MSIYPIYAICVYIQLILVCPNEEIHSFGDLPLRSSVYYQILEMFHPKIIKILNMNKMIQCTLRKFKFTKTSIKY